MNLSGTYYENFLDQTSNMGNVEKGLQFELLCKALLEKMGLTIDHSGQSGDRGVDLVASDSTPVTGGIYLIQCKHVDSVSQATISQLYGMVNTERAIYLRKKNFSSETQISLWIWTK